jgi:hypothetical protein
VERQEGGGDSSTITIDRACEVSIESRKIKEQETRNENSILLCHPYRVKVQNKRKGERERKREIERDREMEIER